MKTNRIFLIVALLGTVLAGCQKTELVNNQSGTEPSGDQIWKLTVYASKSIDTRALELDGSELKASWNVGEKVAVYFEGTKLGTLAVTGHVADKRYEIAGMISKPAGLNVGSNLMLIFPGRDDEQWTYVGQDGSAPSVDGTLATLFDYSSVTVSVSAIDNVNHKITVPTGLEFVNQQSMYRFGFLNGGAGDPVQIKSFTLTSSQGKIVRTRTYEGGNWVSNYGSLSLTPTGAYAGNLYYMSIRNEATANDVYSFSIVGTDDALYEGTQSIKSTNLSNGKFLGAKAISISKKTLAPAATGSISSEVQVL